MIIPISEMRSLRLAGRRWSWDLRADQPALESWLPVALHGRAAMCFCIGMLETSPDTDTWGFALLDKEDTTY